MVSRVTDSVSGSAESTARLSERESTTTDYPGKTEINYTVNNYYGQQDKPTDPKPLSSDYKTASNNSVFIVEATIVATFREALQNLTESLGDPLSFEQDLAVINNCLNKLEERKSKREVYFTDMLTMLRNILSSFKFDETSAEDISCINEIIQAISRQLKIDDITYYRRKFRESKLEILPAFKTDFDIENSIKEIFG